MPPEPVIVCVDNFDPISAAAAADAAASPVYQALPTIDIATISGTAGSSLGDIDYQIEFLPITQTGLPLLVTTALQETNAAEPCSDRIDGLLQSGPVVFTGNWNAELSLIGAPLNFEGTFEVVVESTSGTFTATLAEPDLAGLSAPASVDRNVESTQVTDVEVTGIQVNVDGLPAIADVSSALVSILGNNLETVIADNLDPLLLEATIAAAQSLQSLPAPVTVELQ